MHMVYQVRSEELRDEVKMWLYCNLLVIHVNIYALLQLVGHSCENICLCILFLTKLEILANLIEVFGKQWWIQNSLGGAHPPARGVPRLFWPKG